MSTIPHYALQHNPQKPYTIYALVEPIEPVSQVTWKDVRYVGMSINVSYRYQQHLACRSDDANEDKVEWIQSLLAQGKFPQVHEIEQLATIEEARKREQYWIRHAMNQGASLLNRAITYTEDERTKIHAKRAIRYAKIAEVLARGVYVKRWSGNFYPPRLLSAYYHRDALSLVETLGTFFRDSKATPVSVHDASDEEFEAFIRRYIPIYTYDTTEWTLEERCNVIEFAMHFGAKFDFCEPPPQPEKKSRKRKK